MSTEIQETVRDYIVTEILEEGDLTLQPDAPLLRGLLDSFALMQLVAFLEDTYDMSIQPDEVVEEHFQTLSAIGGFVTAKSP